MFKKSFNKFNPLVKTLVLAFFCIMLICSFSFTVNFSAENFNNNLVVTEDNYCKEYLKYLTLSEEEKQQSGVIPRMYNIDVNSIYSSPSYLSLLEDGESLPTEYSLYRTTAIYNNFDYDNRSNFANLPKNVGNQKNTGICWSFASNTAFESTLYKMGKLDLEEDINLSELNLAYTSIVLTHGATTIGGGNFEMAYEYFGYNLGPVYEQDGESGIFSTFYGDSYTQNLYVEDYLDTAQLADFSALEACYYPARSSCTTNQQKTDLRNAIKNHIYTYGAVTAAIASHDNYYNYNNATKTWFCNPSSADVINHLITLVGWDDNFQINYEGQTLTGAYIAQNSWGEDWGTNGYFYIMYADAKIEEEVAGFIRMGNRLENDVTYNNFEGTDLENSFFEDNSNGNIYYQTFSSGSHVILANLFETAEINGQYLSRIKVPTMFTSSKNETSFYVYVLNNLSDGNVSSSSVITNYLANNYAGARKIKNKYATTADEYLFTANQMGMYTIELDQLINLTNDYFAVIVEYCDGAIYLRSNVDGVYNAILSKQRTYVSYNSGSSWGYFDVEVSISGTPTTIKENLPMLIQTEYQLGDIVYTAQDVSKTYDSTAIAFDVNVSNLTAGEYTIYYSLTGNSGNFAETLSIKDAGTYKVYYKIVADFYNTVVGEDKYFNVTISKKVLTVEPVNQQKTYDGRSDTDPILDFTVSGKIKGETPKFSNNPTRESGNDVGLYNIVYDPTSFYLVDNSTFKASNYEINFVSGAKLQILPRELLLVPSDTYMVYGGTMPTEVNYTVYNAVYGETPQINGSFAREEGNDVGSYSILSDSTNPLTLANNGSFKANNYTLVIDETNNAFHITPKAIVVTPNEQFKVYNTADPEFTYTHTGEVNGEEANFYGALTREEGENVGSYEITFNILDFYLVDNNSFKASNYYIVLTPNVTLTITYGSLTGCEFDNVVCNYNGEVHYLTAQNNQVENVTITYCLTEDGTYSNNLIGFKDVNLNNGVVTSYTIYAKFECQNYNTVIMSATLTINKINIVVTPQANQTKVYDGTSTVNILFNNTGAVSGEEPVFSGALTCYNLTKDVGEYLIVNNNLQLENSTTLNKNNYNFVFDNSSEIKFEITKRSINVYSAENQSKYYGQADTVIEYEINNLVEGEVPNNTGAFSRQAGEDVDNYEISLGTFEIVSSATFNANNYNITYLCDGSNYQIKQANITVKVNNVSVYYGETPTFTYVIEDNNLEDGTYKEGDELNVEFSCAVTTHTKKNEPNVDYTIYATTNNANYNVTIINGLYNVLYKTYAVYFKILQATITLDEPIEHFSFVEESQIPEVNIAGYNFKGWKVDSVDEYGNPTGSYKNFVYNQDYIERETTIIANMEEIEYTASFHTNSEQAEDYSITYTINSATYNFTQPSKKGYTFVNWYNNNTFEGDAIVKLEKGSIGNKNYYAKWQINVYQIIIPIDEQKFEVVFDSILQNGTNAQVEYNNNFSFKVNLKAPYSKSNTVVSFNTEEDENKIELTKNANTLNYTINNIESNVNLFVENLTLNSYTINFVIDNVVSKTITKNYGEQVLSSEYPILPEKTYYNMVAPTWSVTQIDSVEKDYNINSVYTPNVYNITFVVNDGNTYETTLTYGETVSDEILKENYNLNMFEYFDFDSNLFGISEDTTINVTIKSNIYILYIVLASIGVIIVLTSVALVLRKKSKSKLKWWAYVKNPDKTIKKK